MTKTSTSATALTVGTNPVVKTGVTIDTKTGKLVTKKAELKLVKAASKSQMQQRDKAEKAVLSAEKKIVATLLTNFSVAKKIDDMIKVSSLEISKVIRVYVNNSVAFNKVMLAGDDERKIDRASLRKHIQELCGKQGDTFNAMIRRGIKLALLPMRSKLFTATKDGGVKAANKTIYPTNTVRNDTGSMEVPNKVKTPTVLKVTQVDEMWTKFGGDTKKKGADEPSGSDDKTGKDFCSATQMIDLMTGRQTKGRGVELEKWPTELLVKFTAILSAVETGGYRDRALKLDHERVSYHAQFIIECRKEKAPKSTKK